MPQKNPQTECSPNLVVVSSTKQAYCATAHSSRLHRKISFSRRKRQGIIIPKDARAGDDKWCYPKFLFSLTESCEMHAPFIISVGYKERRTCPLATSSNWYSRRFILLYMYRSAPYFEYYIIFRHFSESLCISTSA